MINFRFHLVSLIAVFLALGLGILVGSTVVDQGIVNRLDSEIKSVQKENRQRKATSAQVAKQNSDLQKFIDSTLPYVGDGRLDNMPIVVVAERGVDSGVVKQTLLALQGAGANVPAVVWLEDSWRLDTNSRIAALQSALGLQGNAATTRDAAFRLLAQRFNTAPAGTPNPNATTTSTKPTSTSVRRTTTTSVPLTPPPVDVLTALDKSGFIRITDGHQSAFDTFPEQRANVVVVTGDDSDFAGTDLTPSFVHALVDRKLPVLVAADYDGGSDASDTPKRGAALAPVLDDRVLSKAASTVDDLELVQGRVAAVLSLEIIGNGNSATAGHYGYGVGASAPLPPHHP